MFLQVSETVAKVAMAVSLIIFIGVFALSITKMVKRIYNSKTQYKIPITILAVIYFADRLVITFSLFLLALLIITMPLQDGGYTESIKQFLLTNDGVLAEYALLFLVISILVSIGLRIVISNLLKKEAQERKYEEFINPFEEENEEATERISKEQEQKKEQRAKDFEEYLQKIRDEKKQKQEVKQQEKNIQPEQVPVYADNTINTNEEITL